MMYFKQKMACLLFCKGILLFLLVGCTAHPVVPPPVEPPEPAQCVAGEFRGVGVGSDEKEALSDAKIDLAKQVHSSVRVSEKYSQSQNMQGGKETLGSDFVSETLVEANLLNAQDARVLSVEQKAGKVSTLVCMSREDAAKGFIERGRLVADSLDLVSHVLLNTSHPKLKNEAWNKTQKLWSEYVRIKNLLDSWSVKSLAPKTEIIEKAADDYKSYCRSMKIHWEDSENECSNAAFAKLSKKTNMERAACSSGFRFSFSCEEKCKSLPFGVECSFEPSLAIENCDGEMYFLLRVPKPITGSDMHNRSKALDDLAGNLPKAAFFEQWEKEIREWVPQCVE
jgi:hypothetical protein